MMPAPFRRVVLTADLPEEGLRVGDIGVVVDHYPGREDLREGYELVVPGFRCRLREIL